MIEASQESLNLAVFKQKQKVNGDWGVAKRYKFSKQEIEWAPAESQQLLRLLTGYEVPESDGSSYRYYDSEPDSYESFEVVSEWSGDVWNLLAQSERVFWSLDRAAGEDAWRKISVDVMQPYSLELKYDEK